MATRLIVLSPKIVIVPHRRAGVKQIVERFALHVIDSMLQRTDAPDHSGMERFYDEAFGGTFLHGRW
jgi:hypothetical protein